MSPILMDRARVCDLSGFGRTPEEALVNLRRRITQFGREWDYGHLPVQYDMIRFGGPSPDAVEFSYVSECSPR